MGVGSSYNMTCPPNGALITLQDPQECLQGKPVFKDSAKPPMLAAMPDNAWKGFANKVSDTCARYWDERLPFLGLVFALFPFVNAILTFTNAGTDTGFGVTNFISIGFVFLAVGTVFGGRVLICNLNQAQDHAIRMACEELRTTSHGSFTAEYRTMWTGPCKPKHARTMRVICISSASGMVGMAPPQSITVTVPAGVSAGATLQVQTPTGIQSVTVPPGVSPGQTFAFTPTAVPAPVIVQAQVVGGAV
ncbi:SLC34A1 [Symbiodinium microadriaticum]|nr:SLC34A1 [Symbiodinium microadriaticum]CAE7943960.1 SLC34A1 [Symbiodinium sp. KB8]